MLDKMKIGATLVVSENIWEGHPEQFVRNPNPDGRTKYITRRAAQQWLRANGKGPLGHKEHKSPTL